MLTALADLHQICRGMTCDTSAELFLQAQSIRKTYEVGETGTKFCFWECSRACYDPSPSITILNSIPIWHNVGPSIYQNKIWPSTTRNNGRLPLQCSFPQAIVKRLKEERMGFDNQLAGIERTLKACHWEMVGIRYWRISRYIDLLKFGLWYLASLLDFSLASRQRSGTMKSFFCCPMMLTTPRRGGVPWEGWFRANPQLSPFWNWKMDSFGEWEFNL